MSEFIHNRQLRIHLKYGVLQRIRYLNQKLKLGFCGKNVYFDHDVGILRYPKNISISDNVVLREGVRICCCNEKAQIRIGKNTTVEYHTFIFASEQIEIGDDCLIAPFVYIVDSDHSIGKDRLINLQPNITAPIWIGKDVWIGTGAKILRGVKIGEGAVVATGSVVKDEVPPYKIVGGVPAKIVGERI
jgi:acetyltransferase-like isoleucine patch superfamily enzyme